MRRLALAVGLLSCWVASGAHSAGGAAAKREWPFSRPRADSVPKVANSKLVRNEIDAFVVSKLMQRGLQPAPEASRRTLIRRLTFDLIGLPPSPDEVEQFVADDDPRAYEKLVDRLLKDPRYGERWARLWLDLARYADTAGYEGDPDLPHVWRYRDYVIDTFNNDKPYDTFIREQIAGDESANIMGAGDLPGVAAEHVVALTFLRLAPFTEPRGDETRHELLSEMTSTVSSVFLGLTVGCAKCHDHKYDNIPTRDFYRMKAFFSTVSIPRPEPGDGFQIGGPLPAKFYRPAEEQWAAKIRRKLESEAANAKRELAELQATLKKRVGGGPGFGLQAIGGPLGNNYIYDLKPVNNGQLRTVVANCDGSKWQFFTDESRPGQTGSSAGSNRGQWFGDLPQPRHITLGQYTEGTGAPKARAFHVGRFAELLIYDHPLTDAERQAVADYVASKYNGKTVANPSLPKPGLRFWLDAGDLDADPQTPNPAIGHRVARWIDRVSGVSLEQATTERQPTLAKLGKTGQPAVDFDDDFLAGAADKAAFLKDQQGSVIVVFSARHTHEGYAFAVGGNGAMISTFINPTAKTNALQAAIDDPNNPLVTTQERQRYRYLATRGQFVGQHLKRLKPVAMSLRHSYGPPYEPGVPVTRVMIRGEFDNPGEAVRAGFPICVTGEEQPAIIRLDPFKRWPTRSRRMALANWIASSDNPLTARVMVNRLWHWHFGRGIVATPSDFGALSGGPSHPELLDWLAVQFIKHKWSIKAMHRLIVTSRTYRQRSVHDNPAAQRADPDNKLVWRFRRRRLEAEAVRDAVLVVSGRLNPEQFGLPIFPPLPNGIEESVKWNQSKWDTQHGPEGRKRSIYIYQQRTLTMPFMQVFDSLVCDESRPRRRHSVTPLQALAMYNGDFVNDEAAHFAMRIRKRVTDADATSKQVTYAFVVALGRAPTPPEMTRMLELIDSAETPETGLVGLCRVLFNSNEFVYVD